MILSSLPVSKAVLGIGTIGILSVSATVMGIHKLISYSPTSRSLPKCRIFFYEGQTNQETFKETTFEALRRKSYENKDDLIRDVQTACDSTDLIEKPHYKWRIYIKEEEGNKGSYSKTNQKTLGERHDGSIDKIQSS